MFRPAGLLATQIAPTDTAYTVLQPWLLHPSLSRCVTSPCPGYANRPTRAIDGMGTFTPSNAQPCRLLPQRRASAAPAAAARHERRLVASAPVRCSATPRPRAPPARTPCSTSAAAPATRHHPHGQRPQTRAPDDTPTARPRDDVRRVCPPAPERCGTAPAPTRQPPHGRPPPHAGAAHGLRRLGCPRRPAAPAGDGPLANAGTPRWPCASDACRTAWPCLRPCRVPSAWEGPPPRGHGVAHQAVCGRAETLPVRLWARPRRPPPCAPGDRSQGGRAAAHPPQGRPEDTRVRGPPAYDTPPAGHRRRREAPPRVGLRLSPGQRGRGTRAGAVPPRLWPRQPRGGGEPRRHPQRSP